MNSRASSPSQPLTKPIFIVGLHRTGSTLLRNILDRHPNVAMLPDEMHISEPFRNTLEKNYRKLGKEGRDNSEELARILCSGELFGSFWQDLQEMDVSQDAIKERLRSEQGLGGVVTAVLQTYKDLCQKSRVGVKYPLHISRVSMLMNWFPDAKFIYLARDPRGIIWSKLKDKATRRRMRKAGVFGFFVLWLTMGWFIHHFRKAAKVHKKYRNTDNWHLVLYEDLVQYPEQTVESLCRFCEIDYHPSMLVTTGKESSHAERSSTGIDNSSADVWRKMNKFQEGFIRLCTRHSRRVHGYF